MSLSTRLKYLEKESTESIDIVEEIPFTEFVMESLSKKVAAIPVWADYDYAKQLELVLSFLEHKFETEYVDVKMSRADIKALAEEFLKTNNGFGLLDRFLARPEVNAVMVNSYGSVYVQAFDEFKKTASVLSENQFKEITARFSSDSPIIRERQNNLFITIMKPPVSDNMIVISKIKDITDDLSDLCSRGQVPPALANFFAKLLQKRKNLIVSGNTQAGVCEFIKILQNSISDGSRISIIEDNNYYRPTMDNVSAFSVSSLDDLDYEFLLDSVSTLAADYVIADISDNSKFSSYYSQLSNTDKGLLTGVKAQNVQDVAAKFINSALISLKCTEKQAKLKLSAIYDYVIHVEYVKGVGIRIDSVMEITTSKTLPFVMNEVVKLIDGDYVLDLPQEFLVVEQQSQTAPLKPSKTFRSRIRS